MNFHYNIKDIEMLEEDQFLSLGDLLQLFTVGSPTILQKAVFLCKFQRGLDTSTFADRFNFEAWEQLAKWFGSEDYTKWNLNNCPVPIKLTRIKTNVTHVGFLDQDAISALQDYLHIRERKTQKKIKVGEPIFLNQFNKPITEEWMRVRFSRMVKNSGILTRKPTMKRKITSHMFRALLKSTLLACNTDPDAVEHVIGHKNNIYRKKEFRWKTNVLRLEYAKVSDTINIFSRLDKVIESLNK